jgi:hypothetical protein
MTENIKVENNPGWVKNSRNKAVLNTDLSALEQRRQNKKKIDHINSLERDLSNVKLELNDLKNELKSEIKDIKDILLQFINSNSIL